MPYDPECPHCNPADPALEQLLQETKNFRVVADVHPLTEGHVLIIPKEHYSCVGEFSTDIIKEFESLYNQVSLFVQTTYENLGTFEHGKIGQTVFHAHVHLLPYKGSIEAIVPEESSRTLVSGIKEAQKYFQKDGQYLFVSVGNKAWMVDVVIGKPRFFRDRFAAAFGHPERGNWKAMHQNTKSMNQASEEIARLVEKWRSYSFDA